MSSGMNLSVRNNINVARFAEADPAPRPGRPTKRWVLVQGTKNVEPYVNSRGDYTIIEGGEREAYAAAQTTGKRAGKRLRAASYSSIFH